METLLHTINNSPIIDHHAHNLLLPNELQARDFLSITTEAEGPALAHATSALSHLRAVKQLSNVLNCSPTWEAVQASVHEARDRPDSAWAKQCFQGIETVLIDDGLDKNTVHPYDWHNQLVPSPCKRIVRIEDVAESLTTSFSAMTAGKAPSQLSQIDVTALAHWWFEAFDLHINGALEDPEVVGFKSVICYRTGLNIKDRAAVVSQFTSDATLGRIMRKYLQSPRFPRVQDEDLNPFLVHRAAGLIARGNTKPFQFHTGLGDNDIQLTVASPSHMQSFIEEYSEVPIVLLHAAYPFTKEAGYLASVYANCYLDIGEVFPFVSQEGQETVIRESLELCPSEKLMWSTDGHWYPETYLLAVLQVKEGLKAVFTDMVQKKHIEIAQAIQIVEDIYFNTANKLYKLNLEPIVSTPAPVLERLPSYREVHNDSESIITTVSSTATHRAEPLPIHSRVPTAPPQYPATHLPGYDMFESFIANHPGVRFLRMTWMDYTATPRLRILPLKTAISLFKDNKTLSITQACLGLLQNDVMSPGFGPAGEHDLIPDFSSLQLCEREGWATVACEFWLSNDDGTRSEVDICPRTLLRRQVELGASQDIKFLIGFEIEIVFMPHPSKSVSDQRLTSPAHAWSVTASLHPPIILPLLEEITTAFEKCSIPMLHFHPESSQGQFEFVLEAQPPLQAVDTLLAAKETISSIAARHNLRATCVPKPYPSACGTGAHIHTSMTPSIVFPSFYAGILKHLKGIAAFSLCNDDSYKRMQDGLWAGGRWVSWGTKNKEGALRKIADAHWELKWCDGFANFYLVLAAYLAAGLHGIDEGLILEMADCTADPAQLDDEARKKLGITKRLWGSFPEALRAIEDGAVMKTLVGERAVEAFVRVKRAEMAQLREMGEEERRVFLVERY